MTFHNISLLEENDVSKDFVVSLFTKIYYMDSFKTTNTTYHHKDVVLKSMKFEFFQRKFLSNSHNFRFINISISKFIDII
jgi:hypothetical protein